MALKAYDTFEPQGDFPVVKAVDVAMPDGTKLTDTFLGSMTLKESATTQLKPGIYHVFGEVSSLSVELVAVEDGKVNEYCFEFIPAEDFTELTITPTPVWVAVPQYPVGKTCQVSILRGIGVMVCA